MSQPLSLILASASHLLPADAELAVGNIVRRVLHLVREEADLEDADTLAVANSMDHAAAAPSAARAVSFADSEEERPGAERSLRRMHCRRFRNTEASHLNRTGRCGGGGGGGRGRGRGRSRGPESLALRFRSTSSQRAGAAAEEWAPRQG